MGEQPSAPNGAMRWRPAIPTAIVAISVIVAVGAVSGLVYLLYNRTRGPGEILREFARRVDAGDCRGSYALLASSERERLSEETWCDALPVVDRSIDAGFDLKQAVLRGDVAEVTIEGADPPIWSLERHRRTWRVLLPRVDLGPPFGPEL